MATTRYAAKKTKFPSITSLLAGNSDRPTFKTLLSRMYGTTKTGRPNLDKASADLGVSKRTMQRWVKNGEPAQSKAGTAAQQRMTTWKNSPEGRRARISPRREQRLRQGFQIKVTGTFVISQDRRPRRDVGFDISDDHANAMFDSYLSGNDAGVNRALDDAAGDAFGGSVHVEVYYVSFAGD